MIDSMTQERSAHPDNAQGPFYVEYGCCLACDLPRVVAPDHFAYDGNSHCFVTRQPQTSTELSKLVRAVWGAEAECIRYRGNDPGLLRRLAELGLSHCCDISPPPGIQPQIRNCVSFVDTGESNLQSAAAIGESLRSCLQSEREAFTDRFAAKFRNIKESPQATSFEYAWFEQNFHSIEVSRVNWTQARWLIRHGRDEPLFIGLSALIHDWLIGDGRFGNIRWYTEQALGSDEFSATPW
jgi:hypothetical protein